MRNGKMKKVVSILICVVAVLLGCVCTGLIPGQTVDLKEEVEKEGAVYYSGYLVRANGLGAVTVFEIDIDAKPQRVAAWKGTYLDKIQTHGTMLSLRKGMTLPQVIAAAGLPDGVTGSGIVRLAYNTLDGYTYAIRLENTSAALEYDVHKIALESVMIFPPEGDWLSVEDAAVFQRCVRLVYLGVAAVLGGVLAVLLTVPSAIRKRKAKKLLKQEG